MFWLVVICIALVIVFTWCCSPTKGETTQKTVQQSAPEKAWTPPVEFADRVRLFAKVAHELSSLDRSQITLYFAETEDPEHRIANISIRHRDFKEDLYHVARYYLPNGCYDWLKQYIDSDNTYLSYTEEVPASFDSEYEYGFYDELFVEASEGYPCKSFTYQWQGTGASVEYHSYVRK